MSLLLEPISADSDGEESQSYENDLPSLAALQIIEIDDNKMAAMERVIEKIVDSKGPGNLQIIEAGKVALEISCGIKAIVIPLSSAYFLV